MNAYLWITLHRCTGFATKNSFTPIAMPEQDTRQKFVLDYQPTGFSLVNRQGSPATGD